jgi:tripartite-type tricarboxylate transporter receptor subunit TctC
MSQPAEAQSYPVRPVRIVTTAPGSANDVVTRLIVPKIALALGQPVVIDNRGFIASEIAARAAPDGYTLISYGSPLWLASLLHNVPYDAVTDFAPVTLTAESPNVLVVHASLPVKSVTDLVAFARARPGELNYGSASSGGSPQLAAELFKSMTGVNIVRVPYKGSGPALVALVGGEVQVMFPAAGAVTAHVRTGKVKALAVTSAQPSALAPGLPTVSDSGVPGYQASSLLAILAPAKTPPAIVAKLNREIVRALAAPDVKERMFSSGMEAVGSSPEQLAATIKSEIAKWGRVIKEAGIRE